MTIFDRTKELAKIRGLSLIEIEKRANLSEKSLYKWKTSNPSSDNLQKVADVLHVSTDYLLGRTNDPSIKSDEKTKYVELTDDDIVMAFNGKPISDKYLRAIKAFLEEDDD